MMVVGGALSYAVHQLGVHQASVEALLLQQVLVGAVFHHVTIIQDDDLIGVAHGGEAVGDDQSGAAFHEAVQGEA